MQLWDRVPIAVQTIEAPLSQFAVFLVVTVRPDAAGTDEVAAVLRGLDDLLKDVGVRDLQARLSCVAALGSEFWDRVSPGARPQQLRPFRSISGAVHTAPATPGDVLFHIRADRQDVCFEFTRILMDRLGAFVDVVDETPGFRYFDTRDLLGFVDGTADPTGGDIASAAVIGEEDPDFTGGSYVVVQKYLHDLTAWAALGVDQQERIIGRTKVDNIELPDATSGQRSHKTLNTIVDEDGAQQAILRDNMPFGSAAAGVFGTYFIGYSNRLWVTERMLEHMFVGVPPGQHDRTLDVSRAVTGTTFFAPSAAVLATLGTTTPASAPPRTPQSRSGTSLGLGALRS